MALDRRSNKQIVSMITLIGSSVNKKLSKRHTAQMMQSSNMDFEAFSDICILFDIAPDEFDEYRNLIDKILVSRRHQIAHGSYLRVEYDDFVVTSDSIISVMRMFRNRLENSFVEMIGEEK